MRWPLVLALGRGLIAWGTVALFLVFGAGWLADLTSPVKALALFAWLLGVIVWCAFGVVEQADHLAEILDEPLGTLILTLSIVVIEVALISAVMLGATAAPTLGRDTMFAVLMIVLNGVVGLALLLGGLRYHQQDYNLQGAIAYIAVIVPLSAIALVLPNFTRSTPEPTLTGAQAFFFAAFTVLLYGVFLGVQTVRHRHFFVEPARPGEVPMAADAAGPVVSRRAVIAHATVLLVLVLPIVLLAKQLAKLIDYGIGVLGAPPALGGVLIALVVFTPEGLSALRAALANQLQRAVNLCLGAALSTIGLTVPAVLATAWLTGHPVVLGLDPASMVLLAVTLVLSVLTFGGSPTTTVLEGAVHLVVFLVYVVLIFSP
jgi:Ca2+:H+ antiporter